MKKTLLCLIILVLFVVLFVSCDTPYDAQTQQESAEYVNEAEVEPDLSAEYVNEVEVEPDLCIEDEAAIEGIIVGDVLFNDIEISRIFLEPFVDVLGPPLAHGHGAFFIYDDNVSIMSNMYNYGSEPHQGMAIHLSAFSHDLHQFELNGVTFDMNRTDLIMTLGNPVQYYGNHDVTYSAYGDANMISYHILSHYVDYVVLFRFGNADDRTEVTSISIFRQA